MKKTLLICLMGYLFLPISTLTAQVADSPPETDLVDYSGIPGQEGASPSARMEGMLYLEITSPSPPDTLWVTFWEHLISDRLTVTPGLSLPITGRVGNFFEGSFKNTVYEIPFPTTFPKGYLSLGSGDQTFARYWYFSSEDRVRMRVDLNSATMLFGGPDAEFYRTQYELDRIFAEESFNRNPVMVTSNREGLFQDSSTQASYQKALQNPDDLYIKMDILQPGENAWFFLQPILGKKLHLQSAWQLLTGKSQSLTEPQMNALKARLKGELFLAGVKKAEFAEEELSLDTQKWEKYLEWTQDFSLESQRYSHPKLIEASMKNASLKSRYMHSSFFSEIEGYSPLLKDQVIAFYVLDNFNRLGDRLPEVLENSRSMLTTPWISDRIAYLADMQGKKLTADLLWDMDGKTVDLRDFQDKTLLIHFWIAGCKFCVYDYATVLQSLAEKYSNDPDILLVTVNVEDNPDKWKQSIATGKYTSENILNLRADPNEGFIEHYRIYSFPQKMIIAPGSKVILQTINRMEPEELSTKLQKVSTDYSNSNLTTQAIYP